MKSKKTTEQFKQEVFDISNGEYIVTGEYFNAKTKIEIKHIKCGTIFKPTPDNFINKNSRCPKCKKNKPKKTTEQFKQEVSSIAPDYEVIGDYTLSKAKIEIRHIKCGTIYSTIPDTFLNGYNRCPLCYGKNTEQFKQKVLNLTNGEYIVIGEYTHSRVKIKIKHLTCGLTYETRPNNFLSGHRCPYCIASKGELEIIRILEEQNINFETQYRFKDCKYKNLLPFDFYIQEKNILIEYDGKQHDEPHAFNRGSTLSERNQNFIDLMTRDDIKTNFAIKNGLTLIRINHKDFDKIEKILYFG